MAALQCKLCSQLNFDVPLEFTNGDPTFNLLIIYFKASWIIDTIIYKTMSLTLWEYQKHNNILSFLSWETWKYDLKCITIFAFAAANLIMVPTHYFLSLANKADFHLILQSWERKKCLDIVKILDEQLAATWAWGLPCLQRTRTIFILKEVTNVEQYSGWHGTSNMIHGVIWGVNEMIAICEVLFSSSFETARQSSSYFSCTNNVKKVYFGRCF